jgi:hypothetical protein
MKDKYLGVLTGFSHSLFFRKRKKSSNKCFNP